MIKRSSLRTEGRYNLHFKNESKSFNQQVSLSLLNHASCLIKSDVESHSIMEVHPDSESDFIPIRKSIIKLIIF